MSAGGAFDGRALASRPRGPRRPQSRAQDRRLVPGALRRWREVHRLTQREASRLVGYSPAGNMWGLWESGEFAPPYEILLRIIASTGLASAGEEAPASAGDAGLLVEELAQRARELRAARAGE